ncbi:MAG: molybdopterin-guanine dinucleotide biosynthesis protein B [Acidobacteriota bacterium]|nr:molybdopterin-guanine dinucleotide biosynthesis protein B [Acidobacteriota bacterium]
MKIFNVVGDSNTGKTQLIQKLIQKLKGRCHSVGVVKLCSQGFTVDPEGKDSWVFMESGADVVAMISPDRFALQKRGGEAPAQALAEKYFKETDIIFIEGGRKEKGIKKIEVLRKGISEKLKCPPYDILAVVSDMDVKIDKPVFNPREIDEIADFLESVEDYEEPQISLEINGIPVSTNPFVQKIIKNIVSGITDSLDGIPKDPRCISLSVRKK